ncbi:MAG TPA: sugar transferase [Rhizomicrobium sp.]|jgi:undecaprenyl-phosphate galactose phosphotransferase|nr:sugar transferase [Rhizomicrobium sp.]
MAECVQEKYPAALEVSGGRGVDRHGDQARNAASAHLTVAATTAPLGGSAKRCLDLLLSILLLPLAAILSLPIACLVAVGGGSPVYGHLRVGWNGKPFHCYKFRSMVTEAEDELHALLERDPAARLQWLERFKFENDPRVTPLGRVLRYTSLDEIPQIWNVLRGEMSWVGPRPVIPDELAKYGPQVAAYLACRPGITGLWQIRRRRDTTYDQRVAFDVEYARNRTLARDLAIFCLTLPCIFAARDRD